MNHPTLPQESDQPALVPNVCQPLFGALLDSRSSVLRRSTAAGLVLADHATAVLLRDFLIANVDRRLKTYRGTYSFVGVMRNDNFPRNDHIDNNHLLNILLTMIARAEGNRLLKEMENDDPSL